MLGWLRDRSYSAPPPSASIPGRTSLDPAHRGPPTRTAQLLVQLYGVQDAQRIARDRVIVHAPCTVKPVELMDVSRLHQLVDRMHPVHDEVRYWLAVLLNLSMMDPRLGPAG